jgi:thiol-disulfide isomerase/thioredoxin
MKSHPFMAFVALLCFIPASLFSQATVGDAEWQMVEETMNLLKQPKERPKTREEMTELMRTGLKAFDQARALAMKAAPQHPMRWEAALFDNMASGARKAVGVPATEPEVSLAEIMAAVDAKPTTKGDASALDLLKSASTPNVDDIAWLARAEKHMKDYPDSEANVMLKRKINSIQMKAELSQKPLELKFTAVDGREVDLASLRGKVVLIDFWATWCGPCVEELPNVLKAYQTLHPKGFEIIGISLDSSKEKLEAFVKERGMEWPQYFDGKSWQNEISSKYGINSIPAMWLVNKKGMVVDTEARGNLEDRVQKLLAE